MTQIEIYTKAACPFCQRAKQLLKSKNSHFQEISIDQDPEKRERMIERSGRTTVPQIFIDGKHIGGCDDLHALDESDELNKLLDISWEKLGKLNHVKEKQYRNK